MKKILALAVVVSLIVIGCTKNALTGKSHLSLISESQLEEMAITEYRTFLSQNKVVSSSTNKDAEMVKRVGTRIAAAIREYYSAKGMADVTKGYQWEFNLVDSKEVNAWCMPGGKVVVYTGLLPVTQNEAALAIVLGHEITHAVAGHGGERMNNGLAAQGIGAIGDILTNGNPKVNNIFNNIYGPGVQLGVLLPNSRSQEYEADKYGLYFSAMAGYNPNEAIAFWQRMAQAGGAKQPEFLATHPSDENRIAKLKSYMPEALTFYKPVKK
ncbi:MAG: M48 family metallopeptidase [Chitinophagaceae bacterium]|nr:M48 family metallopeptidase [Chitinophagaceae bacterium]